MTESPQTFGQWLRKRRRELDLTQCELARRVSCAQVTIKKLEADELRPSRQLAEAVIQQLGVEPQQVEAFVRFARGGDEPAPISLKYHKNNLPAELTSFIGREREISEIKQAVCEHRLVTLTGSGGTGKTRLSLKLAADLLDRFPDGVWFIELAPLNDGKLISQTILSVLNLHAGNDGNVLRTLCDYLGDKKTLLILDNCEHLVEDCGKLAEELLNAVPGLKILASSREALGVRGETAWIVPSLSLPDIRDLPKVEQLSQYEAMQLFIERARLVRPHFNVTNGNAPAVAQICYHLDGIPLAIELAAARIKMMTAEQINAHLDDRFHLLTSGNRTALPRQQTLRAAIDWSYDLLAEQERLLMQRLAVFAGGWTLEAAEQVCCDDKIDGREILELLTHLVDKSLVIADEQSDGVRYLMLETVKEYARQKLLDSGGQALLNEKYLDYYLKFAGNMQAELKSAGQLEALRCLRAELDNIRTALGWCFSKSRDSSPEKGLEIAVALNRFWDLDYRSIAEGLGWFEKGLALLHGNAPRTNLLRARSLCLAGSFTSQFGNHIAGRAMLEEGISIYKREESTSREELAYARNLMALTYMVENSKSPEARALIEENVAIYRTLSFSSSWELAESLRSLGWNYYWQRDLEPARIKGEESLALFRQLGDLFNISDTIYLLGQVFHVTGKFASARPYYEECLALNEPAGYKEYAFISIYALADLDRLTGDYPAAKTGYRRALAYYQETHDRFAEGATLVNLGKIALLESKTDEAVQMMRKGLLCIKEVRRRTWEAIGLAALADACRVRGQSHRAALWLGAAQIQSESFSPQVLLNYNQVVEATRQALDEKSFAVAWEKGRAMTLDQAVEQALSDDAFG